jgi:hypothetical protein
MNLLRVLDLNPRNPLTMPMIPMENLLILTLKVLILDPNCSSSISSHPFYILCLLIYCFICTSLSYLQCNLFTFLLNTIDSRLW